MADTFLTVSMNTKMGKQSYLYFKLPSATTLRFRQSYRTCFRWKDLPRLK